ncbi:hypothetical protein B0H11DRAFT_2269042 [Mycena galericulata]|nr:hypothetical protein B0H11DRAFT_2269042 [Mycena galericulata]
MFALRFSSLFLFAATLATATPVPASAGLAVVNKRQSTASVTNILTTLQGSTGSILPQISGLSSSGTASDTTVAPLLAELTSALGIATASLSSLPASSKRQTEGGVATTFAGIITVRLPASTSRSTSSWSALTSSLPVSTPSSLVSDPNSLVTFADLLEEVGLTLVVATLGL